METAGHHAAIAIAGNKIDLADRVEVTWPEAQDWARAQGHIAKRQFCLRKWIQCGEFRPASGANFLSKSEFNGKSLRPHQPPILSQKVDLIQRINARVNRQFSLKKRTQCDEFTPALTANFVSKSEFNATSSRPR
jgi:predicted transglutaminase-like cysteine proteinase